jgi:D-alanyl-D-alanine carboxypeptidase
MNVTIKPYIDAARRRLWDAGVRLEMLRERQCGGDEYTRRVRALHRRLGVPEGYNRRGLPLHYEASELVAVSCGLHGEARRMQRTAAAWLTAMRSEAALDGVALPVRWAYRSVEDQAALIRVELASGGATIERILAWMAAPGYSEHHTGRAVDFESAAECEAFEDSPAFDWLDRNAGRFHFRLSYPRDNRLGVAYEPWHWYCEA